MLIKLVVFLACVCFICNTVHSGVSVIPLVNAELGYGQSFYDENKGSQSDNYDLDIVPVITLSEYTSILPRLGLSHTGVLTPKEIEDEGSIYFDIRDSLLFLKLVTKTESGLAFRCEVGGKTELAREATDENWGEGLYDYNTNHVELSLEKKFSAPLSISFGVRPFTTVFPNYSSLAAGTTEVAELQGVHVLDTNNSETFIKFEYLLGKWFLKTRISVLNSDYPDQKVVSEKDGSFMDTKRNDKYNDFSIGFSHILSEKSLSTVDEEKKFRTFIGINIMTRTKTSNQNHFDVERIYGTEHYYDYTQTIITPSATIRFIPSNVELGLSYDIITKNIQHG